VYQKPSFYSFRGKLELPRLWIVLNKEIIFDFIKDFKDTQIFDSKYNSNHREDGRPVYYGELPDINRMIQDYIETPTDKLIDRTFQYDYFGIADILKAADRRIGKKRLLILQDQTKNVAAMKIIKARLSKI